MNHIMKEIKKMSSFTFFGKHYICTIFLQYLQGKKVKAQTNLGTVVLKGKVVRRGLGGGLTPKIRHSSSSVLFRKTKFWVRF